MFVCQLQSILPLRLVPMVQVILQRMTVNRHHLRKIWLQLVYDTYNTGTSWLR